jgi:hypothetical protein
VEEKRNLDAVVGIRKLLFTTPLGNCFFHYTSMHSLEIDGPHNKIVHAFSFHDFIVLITERYKTIKNFLSK